jgi:hypothetical protein
MMVIVLIIIGAVIVLSSVVWLPIVGFQYLFWRMHLILDSVPEDELINRTKDLPEVRAFLEKYENASVWINTDYHIGVDYSITECEFKGTSCNVAKPYLAYLEIRISLDTGNPEHSRFWCEGNNYGRAPIGDEGVLQRIKNCA